MQDTGITHQALDMGECLRAQYRDQDMDSVRETDQVIEADAASAHGASMSRAKLRAQCEPLQDLVKMVGQSRLVYRGIVELSLVKFRDSDSPQVSHQVRCPVTTPSSDLSSPIALLLGIKNGREAGQGEGSLTSELRFQSIIGRLRPKTTQSTGIRVSILAEQGPVEGSTCVRLPHQVRLNNSNEPTNSHAGRRTLHPSLAAAYGPT